MNVKLSAFAAAAVALQLLADVRPRPAAPGREEWTFRQELAAPVEYKAREGFLLRDEYGLSGRTATVLTDLRRFLASAPSLATKELLLRRGTVAGRESYRCDVLPRGNVNVVLTAEDDDGIRRAVYWFEDRVCAGDLASAVRKPWLKDRISRCFFGPIKRPPFFHDELMDDVDYYPPEYLNRLAHEGVNGPWLTVEWRDIAETAFTVRSPDADRRLAKLGRTVERCLDYGIRTWLFCIEPHACTDGDELYRSHPELFGCSIWNSHVMCPASPDARKYIEESVKDVFSRVPGLGGVMMISHGERPTTCLSTRDAVTGGLVYGASGPCARCAAIEPWRIHNFTAESIVRGMRAAGSDGRYVSWLYQPYVRSERAPWVADVARHLPSGVAMAYNFESGIVAEQLGRKRHGGDYWLSQTGPAEGFRAVASAGRESGAPIYAKIQVCNSHECATVPFVPVPGLLYRKYRAMRDAGVSGVLQCWYFGNYPGTMNKAAGELAFETFESGEDDFLRRLAAPQWGANSEDVAKVWRSLSDAYSRYPLSNDMQYYGPFHAGVAWPLSAEIRMGPLARTWKPLDEPGGDAIGECLENHTLEEAAAIAKTMFEMSAVRGDGGGDVLDALSAAFAADRERMRDIGVMRAFRLLVESAADIFGFYLARERAVVASRVRKDFAAALAAVGEMRRLLRREREVSAEMCALAEGDSRLGFHSEAESHQFHPALLRWRCGMLEAEEAKLDAIEAELAAGRPYPFSDHERGAPSFRLGETVHGARGLSFSARFLDDGCLEISGSNPSGMVLSMRLFDQCASRWPTQVYLRGDGWENIPKNIVSRGADVRHYEATPEVTGWRFRIVVGDGEWGGDAARRPAWLHFSDSKGALWPDRPVDFKKSRLNLGAIPPSAYGRIQPRGEEDEKREQVIGVHSATTNGVEVRWFEEMVPMKDGTRLYTYGALPPEGETRGIVFARTPYAPVKPVDMLAYALAERKTLARGYAHVRQHSRGTGLSEGAWIPYESEREDGLATLEWLRRLPHYGGEIFLGGSSYCATVHWSYLDTAPPDVKGAALPVQDVNRYNIAFRNGFFKAGLHGSWFLKGYRKKDKSLCRNASVSFSDFPLAAFSRRYWGFEVPEFDNVVRHPRPDDPFWRSREPGSGADCLNALNRSSIPILLRTAFYDIYTDGVCDMWRGMSAERRANCSLIIEAYGHSGDIGEWAKGTLGEFPGGSREESGVTALDWFDYCRTGRPAKGAAIGMTRYYALWENAWKVEPELADGQRTVCLSLGEGSRSWTYDPRRPLPKFPGSGGICFGGMQLQPPPGFRDDVVSFVLPPIEERLDVRGRMTAELAVSSDCEDTCFYVRVSVDKGDGNWYLLRDDITSLSFAVGKYAPGTERSIPFRFADHAFRLDKGDVLRVDVSSANSQFAPHPNVVGDAFACSSPKVAHNTVYPGRSFLKLPVIGGQRP